METIFAQVVADTWSVRPDDVVISLADTSLIAIGFGTIASRSTVTLSAAIYYASERLRTKVFAIAANMMECAPADLELRNGKVGVAGVPGMEVTLASVAQAARPAGTIAAPKGIDAGLEESFYWEPSTVTWSNATHLARSRWTLHRARSRLNTMWWRMIVALSSTRCWSRGKSLAAPSRGSGAPFLRSSSTISRDNCSPDR